MGFLLVVAWKRMKTNAEKPTQQNYIPLQIPITEQKQKIRQTEAAV